ncbi:MAG: glycosyltransferase, partial [Ferruginibacter sp.]
MTIAVHISHTGEKGPEYLQACFTILAKQYPGHQFIFFKEKNQPLFLQETNCRFFNISPSIKNNLLLHYWYNYKLPGLLQKYNADVFVNEFGVVSLRNNVRQCMLVKDMQNMKHLTNHGKSSRYAKKFFSQFVGKASAVCTSSDFIREILQEHFPADAGKIQTIYPGLSDLYQPFTFQQKEAVLEKHTQGFSYFFYEVTGDTSESLLPLLKAFSQFKKWQKSSFKLLLLYKDNIPAMPVKDFHNYKHKDDIVLKAYKLPAEAAQMTAAAFAVIYLPISFSAGFTGLHALRCRIPLISSDEDFCKNLFSEAARYCKINADDIAKNMM